MGAYKNRHHILFVGHSTLDTGSKELITEEVQGAKEDNSCIISGLEGSYEKCVFANSMRILKSWESHSLNVST